MKASKTIEEALSLTKEIRNDVHIILKENHKKDKRIEELTAALERSITALGNLIEFGALRTVNYERETQAIIQDLRSVISETESSDVA